MAVQSMLPDRLRSIAYDRFGLGWSDASSTARTPDHVVDELGSLLAAIGADPPYVLVGHSLGCRYIRLYAVRHPESVAGLVLVDGFHETWDEAVGPTALASFIAARARLFRLAAVLSRIGLIRLLGKRAVALFGPDLRSLPIGERARYAALMTQPRSMEAATDELRRSGEADDTLRDASFGALPVTVITHGVPFPDDAQERAWQDAQAEIAARSSRGRLVVASGAGHSIMIASPRLVADAIDEMASPSFTAPGGAGSSPA
jgi:pimeloyl-ACP methyl ester carboxylesterase